MKTNQKILILMAVLIFGACETVPKNATPVKPDKTDSEYEVFSKAEENFQRKHYNEALEDYNEYLSGYPEGPFAAMALMKEGTIYTDSGKYATARNVYQYLINRYPKSPLISDARVAILSTFYKEGNYEQIIRHADGVLKNLVSEDHIFRTHVLLGDAYMARGSYINAAYFYITACKERFRTVPCPVLTPFEKQKISAKMKKAISRLSSADINGLLERFRDDSVAGYIMYLSGVKRADEERREDALNILSEFVRVFPEHENVQQARQLIKKLDVPGEYEISDQYTIGCLLPLSGQYKVYGNKALKGIQLAVSQLGPRIGLPPINIVIEDTESDPDKAVMGVRKLFNEHAAAIVGPIFTAEAAASEAQDKKIPIITLTQKNKITGIGDYVFRNFMTPGMQVKTIVSYAIDSLGLYSFAILYPDEKYGATFMSLFQDEVVSYGGEVVAAEPYNPRATDFAGPIRRIRSGRPDAIFIPDGPGKAGLIIPQLAFHDIYNVQLFGTNLWHSGTLIRRARQFVQDAVFPEGFFAKSYSEESRHFTNIFKESFHKKPGFLEAVTYDSVRMIFHILDQYGDSIRFTSDLKDEMTHLRDFPSVTGPTSFDDNGEAHKKLYLIRVKGKGFEEIDY